VSVPTARAFGAAHDLRARDLTSAVTTAPSLRLPDSAGAQRAPLPPGVELEPDAILVVTEAGVRARHALGHAPAIAWVAAVGRCVVVGYAARPGGIADTVMAIDRRTGRRAWRRAIDSRGAAPLTRALLAVERAGAVDVIHARTGATRGIAVVAGHGPLAISRAPVGDLHIKTSADLVAVDRRSGAVRWARPASARSAVLVSPCAVLDAWVDRDRHRFGVASLDPRTGLELSSIELGTTRGWYEREQLELIPDGPGDVLVSALFATS
jgi:hypothetical protein